MEQGKITRILNAFYVGSSLAGGLGLLMPFVALALVLAYGFGHARGMPRLFLGFMTIASFPVALARVTGLCLTLRLGRLKVSGEVVERSNAPQRFWTWAAVQAISASVYIGVAAFFGWLTLSWRA